MKALPLRPREPEQPKPVTAITFLASCCPIGTQAGRAALVLEQPDQHRGHNAASVTPALRLHAGRHAGRRE